MHFPTVLTNTLFLFSTTGWAGYVLEDDYFANGFFNQFTFWDSADPTHGFVDYLSYNASQAAGLIKESNGNAWMGVDSSSNTPNGRPSVRITSNKSYGNGLVVVDIEHMPGGVCGTWPAFWLVGPNWPNGGEIDILEGVNDQTTNDVTLHTGPGCAVSNTGSFTGKMTSTTCESGNGSNQGCQIASQDTASYGAGFNAAKGGVYAMEWSTEGIAVYFFPRSQIPSDVLGESPDPSGWGLPMAHFTGECDFTRSFTQQQLVFDTTFCGDWAGNTWSSSSCAAKADTCNSYVQNNPEAFADAYWSVNALKVYTNNGEAAAPAPSSAVTATSTTMVYVTPPASSTYVAPTTFAVSTTSAGSGGYAPVVGGDGSVGWAPPVDSSPAAAAPTAPSGGGWFSNAPDGSVGTWERDVNESEVVGRRERHARHLRAHAKRHGGKRL